jgi:hypothetical protein
MEAKLVKRPVIKMFSCLAAALTLGALPAASLAGTPSPAPGRGRGGTRRASIVRTLWDPSLNRRLSEATLITCHSAPAGGACSSSVLAAIDAARAGEGVRPMTLPADFGSLSAAQQLLVAANLERVDRGLVPALGLSGSLDQRALTGARNDADPDLEPLYGNWAGSNWAGGYGSALEADFAWMYDDGPGSPNIDCAAAGQPGCWGHRHNIIAPYEAPLAMGAAAVGASMTELFVGHDLETGAHQPDELVAPRWPALIRRPVARRHS